MGIISIEMKFKHSNDKSQHLQDSLHENENI